VFEDLLTEDFAFYTYLGCFLFGLFFAVLSAMLGGVFGSDMGGADTDLGGIDADANVDITSDSVALSPLSPMVICVFLTAFGAFGMIGLQTFELSVVMSAAVGTGGGLTIAIAFAFVMGWAMCRVQGGMDLSPTTIVGKQAEVSITIPEGGLGEITYIANDLRQRASAKSEDGSPIKQSSIVEVVQYSGHFYVVRPVQ
jgi:hypothetical protein